MTGETVHEAAREGDSTALRLFDQIGYWLGIGLASLANVFDPQVIWDGQTKRVDKRRVVLGRSRECDIQVEDANVSRRHAELRQEGATYWLIDLDSTNGVEVRGKRVKRLKLEDGTRFTIGSTEIAFSREIA